MLIPSKVWLIDHWVKFNLISGNYQNIMIFFKYNKLNFLAEMKIDFSVIPISLHGKNNSVNIIEYLSNNSDNIILIYNFLNYFLTNIVILSYLSGQNCNFNFEINSWQNMNLIIHSTISNTTTTSISTTTTTTPSISTTTTTTPSITTTTTTTTTPSISTTTSTIAVTTTTASPINTTTTTQAEVICGYTVLDKTPIENQFIIIYLVNNILTTINTPIVNSFNYMYISIPIEKTLTIFDSLNNNITNQFSIVDTGNLNGFNNNIYRSNDMFYSGYVVEYQIKVN